MVGAEENSKISPRDELGSKLKWLAKVTLRDWLTFLEKMNDDLWKLINWQEKEQKPSSTLFRLVQADEVALQKLYHPQIEDKEY